MTSPLFTFASTVRRMHEGPLGPFVDGFAAFLQERGDAWYTAQYQIRLVADLSRWLGRRGFGVRRLNRGTADKFLHDRRRKLYIRPGDRFCLRLFLDHLVRVGAVPPEPPETTREPARPIERAFTEYLAEERGLTRATQIHYLPFIRCFLTQRFGRGPIRLHHLRADDITRFILRRPRHWSHGHVKVMVTALRSFFRFLRLRGEIRTDLAGCVLTVPNWHLATLPKALPPDEVEQLLKACNRPDATGRRDYAILLLLARLGLRAGEIVALELEDIDWRAGEITVRGKGAQQNRLPLPREVGKALVGYLRHARPRCSTRRVFVGIKAPHRGFAGPVAVSTLVRRALERAGLHPPRTGAHVLRHSVACQMLRRGASLAEIGEVLRHRHPDTTAIYAKVDLERLRGLAPSWPGRSA